jgi:hypothetical protein
MLSNVAPVPLQLGCAMPAPAYACKAQMVSAGAMNQ